MTNHVTVVLWAVASLLLAVSSQSLPYNPTTLLLPGTGSRERNIAYAFLGQTNSKPQFVSFNISANLSAAGITLNFLAPNLPFLSDDTQAIIPSINSMGEILVYTGSCSKSNSSAIWGFTPSNTSNIGNGTWEQEITNIASDVTSASLAGANFLSKGFGFSTFSYANVSQTDIYIFGGMCPSNISTSSTWQSAASYSNHMLRLAPAVTSLNTATYTLDLTTSRGPPIAEAGFTITGLYPTYSDGSGIETQQQNFVLIGGHTQTAFINMSQIAIWSLPEEAWSFVTVNSPTSSSAANTELTIKSTVTSVDSRSGHTTVLSEDGASLIVYGGWVGDVSQAADPQLAILSLGTGFGGSGDWKWTIPADQPTGDGIYGHGAVMLPGNVMMVLGGYNISTSSTSKRGTGSAVGVSFYNATSGTWMSDYTNPEYVALINFEHSSKKTNETKLGLGLGLGLGLSAVLAAIIVGCWYSRHLKQKRVDQRESYHGERGLGEPDVYNSPMRDVGTRSGGFPWTNGRWNGANPQYDSPGEESTSTIGSYENANSGVHSSGEISAVPSPPKQIIRKPLVSGKARGSYQPTPTFDFNVGSHGRNNLGTSGSIHPIYEADEEESIAESHHSAARGVGIALGDPSNPPKITVDTSHRHSDPFKDPPTANFAATPGKEKRHSRSQSVSDLESPAQSREREIQEWVSDWAAADELLTSQIQRQSRAGGISPTRRAQLVAATSSSSVAAEEDSGRTESNLSERSIAATNMSISRSGSSSQGTRTSSLRGLINGMIPFSTTMLSTTVASTSYSPIFDGPASKNLHPPGSSGSNSANSFNTARTSFPALQAEGESLLPRPADEMSNADSPTRSQAEPVTPGTPSKNKELTRGRAGWLGSLRRVFASGEYSRAEVESSHSRPYTDYVSTRDISPQRHDQVLVDVGPRRAVSASATLWRRKQGKGDWDDSAVSNPRSHTFAGESSSSGFQGLNMEAESEDGDDEWDIERAVENRVVQVMFTVPKEKLRVVNHDFTRDESQPASAVGSLKSKKGSGKVSIQSNTGSGKRSLRDVLGVQAVIDERRGVNQPLLETEEPVEGEISVLNEKDVEAERTVSPPRDGSPVSRKSKVLEMVEEMERRSSPER